MAVKFSVSEVFPATAETIFSAWLDSKKHTDMTGGQAAVTDQVGEIFTAWDGYISGKNLELQSPGRILQSWRTTEFDESDPDSILEIQFLQDQDSTRVVIVHSELPEHGLQYQQGWIEAYFTPMKDYFK